MTDSGLKPLLNDYVARIWPIAHLTKCAVQLINLSTAQHLSKCAIFGQSRSALAIRLGLGFALGIGFGLGLVLELGLG